MPFRAIRQLAESRGILMILKFVFSEYLMKIILQDNRRFILRLNRGEEVFTEIKNFAEKASITAGYFSGIGACGEAELGSFNFQTKKYENQIFTGDLEILSLTGNVSLLNGQVALHAHTCLAKPDFSTIGGHVQRMVVSVTCEIFFIKLEGKMERKLDPEMNINLLD